MRSHYVRVTSIALAVPVRDRIEFKVACLVFKSLAGHALDYLIDDCRLISGPLRSADSQTCIVPRTCNRLSVRSLPVSGLHMWNRLPKDLQQGDM